MSQSLESNNHPEFPPLVIPDPAPQPPLPWATVWQNVMVFCWQVLALGAAGVVLLVAVTGTAGWYTSRPQFCNSCHIMEPYYISWQESSHKDVSCIKCHFPPGLGEKMRGKVLGLVQLAKYVTQTQGPRPKAEVSDASCLRSGCHETRLLSGRVDYNGIAFDHARHLPQDESELTRGMHLRCTSCHSQIVQGQHMTVTESTCFLCHFKGLPFNQGLGACTRCHQIPDTAYDLGGGVTFHHDLAYENGVDCASCHADLIRGNGEVPVERCTVCHNREDDLLRLKDKEFLHKRHVTEHKVECTMCHLTVTHALDPRRIAAAVSQCSTCHPNEHHSQVSMLEGTGAKLIPPHPSNMAGARLSCFTCHQDKQVSETGTVLLKASLATCIGCHATSEVDALQAYHNQLTESLTALEADAERIGAALTEAEMEQVDRDALNERFANVQHDIRFLHAGNDIHNSHYASELVAKLLEEMTAICTELELDAPVVELPEKPARTTSPPARSEPTGKE